MTQWRVGDVRSGKDYPKFQTFEWAERARDMYRAEFTRFKMIDHSLRWGWFKTSRVRADGTVEG